ncbi:MAG: hypothetical protein RKR03_07105 [Candidatus Competibacter sp.]|nr:hypothetical protein [Candidatus Competibacter sp.]
MGDEVGYPYRDGNGHAKVGYDIQGGHPHMHLRDLCFEKTGRQTITELLFETVETIFGEAAAMITLS